MILSCWHSPKKRKSLGTQRNLIVVVENFFVTVRCLHYCIRRIEIYVAISALASFQPYAIISSNSVVSRRSLLGEKMGEENNIPTFVPKSVAACTLTCKF